MSPFPKKWSIPLIGQGCIQLIKCNKRFLFQINAVFYSSKNPEKGFHKHQAVKLFSVLIIIKNIS